MNANNYKSNTLRLLMIVGVLLAGAGLVGGIICTMSTTLAPLAIVGWAVMVIGILDIGAVYVIPSMGSKH